MTVSRRGAKINSGYPNDGLTNVEPELLVREFRLLRDSGYHSMYEFMIATIKLEE
jgi:hypothetical protein